MGINLAKKILLGSLLLLPLLGANSAFGYEKIKVLFFILSITLIGFLWKGKGVKWTLISKIAGLFILSLAITSLTGLDLSSSIFGKEPYFQGLILYAYLFLFYLMVKTLKIQIEKYAVVLSISSLLVAFLAIKDWILLNIFNIPVTTYAGRVVSTFGQPNFFAGFLLMTLPFTYLLWKGSNNKVQYLWWGSGILSVIGIFVSYSRAATFLVLCLIILSLINQLKNKQIVISAVFVILCLTIFFSFKYSLGIVGNEFSSPLQLKNPYLLTDSLEKRVYIWPILWFQFIQKPILGYGLENIARAFSSYKASADYWQPIFLAAKDLLVDRSHNYSLDLLVFSGISALVCWLILVVSLYKTLIQKYNFNTKNILLVSLTTYLIWVQFQNQSIVHLIYFWLLAGLIDQRS